MREVSDIPSPTVLLSRLPISPQASETVVRARAAVRDIVHGRDERLLVIVGPCSIHDPTAALEYAMRLSEQRERFSGELEIVMRAYLEKPRTTVGWKGLINDPDLNGTFQITKGLHLARLLLREISDLGMPVAVEFLDPCTAVYTADLVSWGSIGARTVESQIHRELASGLPCPIGFKNGTDGDVKVAADAVRAASSPHHFLTSSGSTSAVMATEGNPDCHVILRGGKQPNYSAECVESACELLRRTGLQGRVLIDTSHGNSQKQPERQVPISRDIAERVASGERRILGVMVESFLKSGSQDLNSSMPLVYGQSVTDGCLGWRESVEILEALARAVEQRRTLPSCHDLACPA